MVRMEDGVWDMQLTMVWERLWKLKPGVCFMAFKVHGSIVLGDSLLSSQVVVNLLQNFLLESHPLTPVLNFYREMLSRDWVVCWTHVYREANHVMDWIANYALQHHLGLNILVEPPYGVHVLQKALPLMATKGLFCKTT